CRAVPLDRRLGHDHYGQESWFEYRRFRHADCRPEAKVRPGGPKSRAIVGHGESEVWLGKERCSDQLLPGGCTRANPSQLRTQSRRCRSLLRSESFTHTNPLEGLNKGGCLVWESS